MLKGLQKGAAVTSRQMESTRSRHVKSNHARSRYLLKPLASGLEVEGAMSTDKKARSSSLEREESELRKGSSKFVRLELPRKFR